MIYDKISRISKFLNILCETIQIQYLIIVTQRSILMECTQMTRSNLDIGTLRATCWTSCMSFLVSLILLSKGNNI